MSNYIFVPIGSYEQHGPHLPPDTDYLIAEKIVKDISSEFNGIIAEGVKLGISTEHKGFKDTKSISPIEFHNEIEALLSKYPNETKFILVNAHGGNNTTLNSIKKNKNNNILVINTFSVVKRGLKKIRTTKIGGICHAGEFETSIMLFLYPELVKMKKLKKKDIKYVPILDPNYEKDKLKEWKTIDYNKRGILGDPFHASVKKGELWYNYLIKNIKKSLLTEL